ncbi:hypothetical protein ABEB36_012559 [Hypothenemus hampei]|uniref:SIAH-type domain-containing protein n=1 Tax=Hypothenemus hampei TaxID=57062 RepID=A0ABD1ECC5_HYPHA
MQTKIYLCPSDKKHGCSWEGSSNDIYLHFTEEHEDLLCLSDCVSLPLEAESENRLLLVNAEIYLLQTRIENEHLILFLRFLGPREIARNLTYDLEISFGDKILDKRDTVPQQGCFEVPLNRILECFGDVNSINCRLQVTGDFTIYPDVDSHYEDDTCEFDLKNFFATPQNSPTEIREHENVFEQSENHRATWSGNENNQVSAGLTRSLTFTSDDLKRMNIKRQASMRSLTAIEEITESIDLKCSNCEGHLPPPIFLCDEEHNICSNCFKDRQFCSICGNPITAARNTKLEAKCSNSQYLCQNHKSGCTQKLPFPAILEHEINCRYCQYTCPISECGVKAQYKQMVAHLNLIHSSVKIMPSFIAVFQKYQEIFLVTEALGIFYCNWTLEGNKVEWKVKFCGPKGKKFFYELKFKGKNLGDPLLLTKKDDCYVKDLEVSKLKEWKVKIKHSILTITR